MNWLDIIIVAGLIAGIVLGFRRGFIREAMGLLGLIVGVFIGFKILGFLFYRVGSLTALGKLDKVGGGIFGFLQAWILTGFVLLILLFFPLPQSILNATDN